MSLNTRSTFVVMIVSLTLNPIEISAISLNCVCMYVLRVRNHLYVCTVDFSLKMVPQLGPSQMSETHDRVKKYVTSYVCVCI